MKHVLQYLVLFIPSLCMAGTTNYVSLTGSHTAPFNSEATAATNIQSAVNFSASGDTVVVFGGHYILLQEITIPSAITVMAAPGQHVVVDGNGASRCFYLDDVACVLESLTISNGLTSANGGGVYCSGDNAILTNCVITECQASSGGGVAGTTAYDCEIRNNHATLYGGGGEETVLYSCTVAYNTAAEDGGGLDLSKAHNSLIFSNTVLTADGFGGGGVSFDSFLVNCTVVNNHSAGDAGGIEGGALGTVVINSIIADNTASGIGMNFNGPIDFTNSCSPELFGGVGNITNAPGFTDAPGLDFRLSGLSPCINAGANSSVFGATDLAGNARIVGGIVDMGAYEFQVSASDADGDGMDDAWEIAYFGSTNALPGGMGDSDLFNNLEEFVAGTDPTNGASYFAITNWAVGSFILEWNSVTNREYTVYWAESLTHSFMPMVPVVEYPENSFTDTVHSVEDEGFYKIRVKLK